MSSVAFKSTRGHKKVGSAIRMGLLIVVIARTLGARPVVGARRPPAAVDCCFGSRFGASTMLAFDEVAGVVGGRWPRRGACLTRLYARRCNRLDGLWSVWLDSCRVSEASVVHPTSMQHRQSRCRHLQEWLVG